MLNAIALQQTLQSLTPCQKFLVAYSGGVDSHVLLHLLSQTAFDIHVVHVNHHLNPKANDWQLHCEQICNALGLRFSAVNVQIEKMAGQSLEAQARDARYHALQHYLDDDRILLTAHHLNDQAETFLLHALRGSGLTGLSAMPLKKKWHHTFHLRPLLPHSREAIESYAKQHHLKWIDDDSNTNIDFDRNYLRHTVMPLLQQRFPATIANLSRSARLLSNVSALINETSANDFLTVANKNFPHQLSIKSLLTFPFEKQKLILRYWFSTNSVLMPSEKQLLHIFKNVIHARRDANPLFQLDQKILRRYRACLYLIDEGSIKTDSSDQAIRTRKPGDRVKLSGWSHSKSIKNYFQEQGIPAWERDRVLLKFENGYCVELIHPTSSVG